MSLPRRSLRIYLVLLLAGFTLYSAHSFADSPPSKTSRDVYHLKAWTIGCAGTNGSANGVVLRGTMGQSSPIGSAESGLERLLSGFWPTVIPFAFPADLPEVLTFETRMLPNAPNPFNPVTSVRFEIASAGRVSLVIYDLKGRLVRQLVNELVEAGRYDASWDGRDGSGRVMASGPYFCRMQADGFSTVQKMLLIK